MLSMCPPPSHLLVHFSFVQLYCVITWDAQMLRSALCHTKRLYLGIPIKTVLTDRREICLSRVSDGVAPITETALSLLFPPQQYVF